MSPLKNQDTPYSLTIALREKYLACAVKGENTTDIIISYLIEIAREALRLGVDRILIEEQLEGPSIGSMGMYKVAKEIESAIENGFDRVAFVDMVQEHRDFVMFAETIARNRGFHFRVFTTVKQAQDWLEE